MTDPVPSKECFWTKCSDSRRCAAFGSCVAKTQAGGATFPQAMPASESPVTQQEIVSAIHHHARELARLTATWPAQDEIERLRTALTGVQSCSTCEACRGAATLALGGAKAKPAHERESPHCSTCACGLAPEPPADAKDAARYRWLRAGNAYAPEENMVMGGEELDHLCDDGISSSQPPSGEPQ